MIESRASRHSRLGLSFSALLDRLIELALERHAARKATRFTR
jgi:hypothetical protein